MTTAIKTSLSLTAVAALLLSGACGGDGNTGRLPPSEALVKQIPWTNGVVPIGIDKEVLYTSALPAFPPIGQNRPDTGSLPVDCDAATALYEFAPWVATFEPEQYAEEAGGEASSYTGMAIRWAGADDKTRGSWRSPGFSTWYPGLMDKLSASVWGTPSQSVTDPGRADSQPFPPGPVPVCGGTPNSWVMHMRGQGFRYYGGNIAHILAGDNYQGSNNCPPDSSLCHPLPAAGATVDSAGFPLAPTKNDPDASGIYKLPALHTYWDGSAYEGISFWARRGPDSFGTLLVTMNEKHTSDDQNRQNETFCRRIYQCQSECLSYIDTDGTERRTTCQDSARPTDMTNDGLAPVKRCYDPAKGMPVPPVPEGTGIGSTDDLLDAIYPRCGKTCTFRSTYPDVDFEGKSCRPYTFMSGESAEYCYNEGELPPPSREERCGDGFTSTVQLSGDWEFYTVPFSAMRQGGYGKRAEFFDLKSLYSITLGWGAPNVDFYLDNGSLYRTKKL